MSRKSNTLLAFLAGAAAGALLGVLYAPDKGSNTREKWMNKLGTYKDQLQNFLNDLMQRNHADTTGNSPSSSGESFDFNAKMKAQQLLDDVDEMLGQMRSKSNP